MSATPVGNTIASPPRPEMIRVSLHIDRRVGALREENSMEWTKPEFTVVAVTMEVTAYAATK